MTLFMLPVPKFDRSCRAQSISHTLMHVVLKCGILTGNRLEGLPHMPPDPETYNHVGKCWPGAQTCLYGFPRMQVMPMFWERPLPPWHQGSRSHFFSTEY